MRSACSSAMSTTCAPLSPAPLPNFCRRATRRRSGGSIRPACSLPTPRSRATLPSSWSRRIWARCSTRSRTPVARPKRDSAAGRKSRRCEPRRLSGCADQAYLALRERDRYAVAPAGFNHREAELPDHRSVVLHRDPRPQGNLYHRLGQRDHLHLRRRILQHPGIGIDQLANGCDGLRQVDLVADTDLDFGLANLAEVVQDFPDHLSIRHHDTRAINVQQRGTEYRDELHLALNAHDLNVVTDPVRLSEDDRQAGDHIAQDALRRQGDTGTGDTQPGNQRQQLDAKILQRKNREQSEYHDPHQAYYQQPYRWLEFHARQPALHRPPDPAPHHPTRNQNEHGDQDLGSETHS